MDNASSNGTPPEKKPRAEEGDCGLPNPYLTSLDGDFLYHIGYKRDEIKGIFGDVKVRSCIEGLLVASL